MKLVSVIFPIGPLTALVNGKITLVGIVSFGRTTCTPLAANGYERVSFQKDWILSNSDAAAWQCGAAVGNKDNDAFNNQNNTFHQHKQLKRRKPLCFEK